MKYTSLFFFALRLSILDFSLICLIVWVEQASCSQAHGSELICIEVPAPGSVILRSSDNEEFNLTPFLKSAGPPDVGEQVSALVSSDLSFTVSSEMLGEVKSFCEQLEGFLTAEKTSESINPLATYKPDVITSTLGADVRDWAKKNVSNISTNREKLLSGYCLVRSESPSNNLIESLILIAPPLSGQVGLSEDKRALSARVFKDDGDFFDTRVWKCDVYGSQSFISKCLNTTHFGKIMGRSNFLSYLKNLLESEKAVVDDRFDQIAADINLLTHQALEEKLSEQSLVSALKSRVDGEAAYNAASKISKRTGPKIITSAAALLQGSSDPIRDASLYKHALYTMRNAFNSEGAQWLIDYFRDSGTLVVTSNQLWIVESNVALVLAENISNTFGLERFSDLNSRDAEVTTIKEKFITQGKTGLDQTTISRIMSPINALDLGDWEPWAIDQGLLSGRPIEPRFPNPLWKGMTRAEAVGTLERAAERAKYALEIEDYEKYMRSIREVNAIFDDLLRPLMPAYNAAMTRYKSALESWLSKRSEVEAHLSKQMEEKKQAVNDNLMSILNVDKNLPVTSNGYDGDVNFFITSIMFWLP